MLPSILLVFHLTKKIQSEPILFILLAKQLHSLKFSGDLKSDHLKSGLFEGLISNGPVFIWSGFSYGYSFSPNHLTFLTKWQPFVWLSNGWASGFQNPLYCNLIYFVILRNLVTTFITAFNNLDKLTINFSFSN